MWCTYFHTLIRIKENNVLKSEIKRGRTILLGGHSHWYIAHALLDNPTPVCVRNALVGHKGLLQTKKNEVGREQDEEENTVRIWRETMMGRHDGGLSKNGPYRFMHLNA